LRLWIDGRRAERRQLGQKPNRVAEERFLHVFDDAIALAFNGNTELARVATARAALVLVFMSIP
jgi:hypothetical protein